MSENTDVVVIGGGYAGVMAADRLTQRDDVTVTLINPRRTFVERIRLHQLVSGSHDAVVDYRKVLSERVRLVVDTVTRIDPAERGASATRPSCPASKPRPRSPCDERGWRSSRRANSVCVRLDGPFELVVEIAPGPMETRGVTSIGQVAMSAASGAVRGLQSDVGRRTRQTKPKVSR